MDSQNGRKGMSDIRAEEGTKPLPYFDDRITNILKGIAIIFMFAHHFFTYPQWYVEGVSYPELQYFAEHFCEPLRICVGIFAFLTGYFYCCHEDKSLRYSFRKITDVLLTYWVVYIPLLAAAVGLGFHSFGIKGFLCELFALERPVMVFCWYVYLYYTAMLALPLMTPFLSKGGVRCVLIGIILPVLRCMFLMEKSESQMLVLILDDIKNWFPCIMSGYLAARFSVFEKVFDELFKYNIKRKGLRVCLWVVLAFSAFLGRFYAPQIMLGSIMLHSEFQPVYLSLDILYTPLFIYALVNLIRIIPENPCDKVLSALGRMSLIMWFLHCIFFNETKSVFQPILYLPKNPVLVLIWGLALCYGAAVMINWPVKWLLKGKNRLLTPSC